MNIQEIFQMKIVDLEKMIVPNECIYFVHWAIFFCEK